MIRGQVLSRDDGPAVPANAPRRTDGSVALLGCDVAELAAKRVLVVWAVRSFGPSNQTLEVHRTEVDCEVGPRPAPGHAPTRAPGPCPWP